MASFANPPSLVESRGLSFLIVDAPSEANIDSFVQALKRGKVTHLVRVCEPTYSSEPVEHAGIRFHDFPFPDGQGPPTHIIEAWLELCGNSFRSRKKGGHDLIAIHCLAGLGRAPVMVAIALIERGEDPLDVVDFIRSKRRGAINAKQLQYLEAYKKRGRGQCSIQ